MKTETEVGPLQITRLERPRREGGVDAYYDLVVFPNPERRGLTDGTMLACGATADEVLKLVRELIMSAAEVHRVIRDVEDPE